MHFNLITVKCSWYYATLHKLQKCHNNILPFFLLQIFCYCWHILYLYKCYKLHNPLLTFCLNIQFSLKKIFKIILNTFYVYPCNYHFKSSLFPNVDPHVHLIPFFFRLRTSFKISYSMGLLVTNSFSFCIT